MMKIIPFLTFFLFIFKVSAENPLDVTHSEDSILKMELSGQEGAKKEFQQLVQSTMDVMGPTLEVSELTKTEDSQGTK